MLDYIWLDSNSPILNQLPRGFKSAVILLHPFIQMPKGWQLSQSNDDGGYEYPNPEEILKYGEPVSWETVMKDSGLTTFEELAVALKTSIGALKQEYKREDLAERLYNNLKMDLYYPTEDEISVFLLIEIFKILQTKGAKWLHFSDPLLEKKGELEISKINPLEIYDLSLKEIIICDENMDFAFMNVYDSFITILMAKDKQLADLINTKKWEAVICDEKTYINWYSESYNRGIDPRMG
jgi:hypothetical protein